jgi:hypothetical protein
MVIMKKLMFGNGSDSSASDQTVVKNIVEPGIFNGVEPLDIFRALSVKPLTSFAQLLESTPP